MIIFFQFPSSSRWSFLHWTTPTFNWKAYHVQPHAGWIHFFVQFIILPLQHVVARVTSAFLHYIQHFPIIIEVFGHLQPQARPTVERRSSAIRWVELKFFVSKGIISAVLSALAFPSINRLSAFLHQSKAGRSPLLLLRKRKYSILIKIRMIVFTDRLQSIPNTTSSFGSRFVNWTTLESTLHPLWTTLLPLRRLALQMEYFYCIRWEKLRVPGKLCLTKYGKNQFVYFSLVTKVRQ